MQKLLLISLISTMLTFPLFTSSANQSVSIEQPVKLVNGYPQFQLHGQPFFAHSTAFFYNRIPRDEWAVSLVKLKEMGINTVDLYIAWNWHEPEEGKLDFDGHSNPRRDVKGLMEMIAEMGFAVIVRPGPVILNEWRNGGYPDWLLAKPEFQMNQTARLDGHYPPLAGVSSSNSEEASKQWMANESHMRYTRRWFADVMREVLKDRQAASSNSGGGNVIAIQLDDDQAINRTNYNGPIFWKYMTALAGFLREAGATVPVYINPTDMRVSAAGAPHNIGAMGQWYFNFGTDAALRWEDTATLQFYTETLKTQPHFPPMIIEYQAGWYGNGEDSYAKVADPTNTLLSSRVMIGHGLRGLNYFPVQDTLYPAGYEVPWANHYYTWESALNLAREERPRASAVHRNGRLIAGLGRELAAAHKAADLGLVYPISSFDQPNLTRDDILRISRTQLQIQQFCQLNQVSVEYLDLEFQPLELLKRHKAILLPTFDEEALKKTSATGREEITAANEDRRGDAGTGRRGEKKFELPAEAKQKLVEFVKAGGILVCTPSLPAELNELKAEPLASRVIVVPDFWRTVPTEPGKTNREELIASVQSATVEFVSRLSRLGINRRVKARVTKTGDKMAAAASAGASVEPDLVLTQLTPDDGKQTFGFISLANFDDKQTMRVNLNVADPASTGRLELPEFSLRARDALMLPLRLPLGSNGEEVTYATAELTKRELANGKIYLRFYAPDAAEVVLSLPHAPAGAVTIDGQPAISSYDATSKRLTIKLVEPRRRANSDDADELAGRRQHELDVEVIYERSLPEVTIKTTKLIIGETNQVAVEISNRTAAAAVRGKLQLTAARLFRQEQFTQDIELSPATTKTFTFAVPIGKLAVAEDQAIFQATLIANSRQFNSPTTIAEILPRFSWQIFPRVTVPLRADTSLVVNPPLLLPSDPNATSAQFSLRTGNNTGQRIALRRDALLLNAPALSLAPDEEMQSTFTFNFPPGTKTALHPFNVTLSDGVLTETAKINLLALRKGEAVAFSYDIDRDGFDDYMLENEFLRLIVSPRAGARAFALINKRTGANVFTSVGGLRDKFVELDPADPTRNARRKRGMYGSFNREYSAEILAGMGAQSVLKLTYDAPDVYPAGARIERTITLKANEEFFTVDYRVTPKVADGKQAFWSASSIVIGDPSSQVRKLVAANGAFDFAASKTRALNGGWLAAPVDAQNTFGVFWREAEAETAEVEMKDFSSLVNLKFKPFSSSAEHAYRLAFYFGSLPPERLAAERMRVLGEK